MIPRCLQMYWSRRSVHRKIDDPIRCALNHYKMKMQLKIQFIDHTISTLYRYEKRFICLE